MARNSFSEQPTRDRVQDLLPYAKGQRQASGATVTTVSGGPAFEPHEVAHLRKAIQGDAKSNIPVGPAVSAPALLADDKRRSLVR